MMTEIYYFLKDHKRCWIMVGLLFVLTYGMSLFDYSYSIDTEDILMRQGGFYDGWIGINRYGMVFLKWLFGITGLIPGFVRILMAAATCLYSLLWAVLFWYLSSDRKQEYWIFPVLFFSSVPVIELTAFQCLSFEVAAAMFFCAFSQLCVWRWILKDAGMGSLCAGILAGIWCFACYQAFVPLYITASLATFLMACRKYRWLTWRQNLAVSLQLFAVFCADYALYNVLGFLVRRITGVQAGNYTDQMIQWGRLPAGEIAGILKHYFADVLLSRTAFWNYGYLFVCVGMLLCGICYVKRKGVRTAAWYSMFITALFLASPFFLPVVMGAVPAVRSQLSLPFVTAFGAQFLLGVLGEAAKGRRYLRTIAIGMVFLLAFRWNIVTGNRLLYTDHVVRQQEYAVTQQILTEIQKCCGERWKETPVVILGSWEPAYNPSMLQGETLGRSFYNWDKDVENGVQTRVLTYWASIGYPCTAPTEEQSNRARQAASEMPVWPEQGSVRLYDGMVIVKLSEVY